jgi:hypothetical protein
MWRDFRVLLVLPLVLAGCFKNPAAPDTPTVPSTPQLQADRIVIVDDPAVLEARVRWTSVPLFIESKEVPQNQVTPDKVQYTDLTLVGEVTSPVVDGYVVQANDIDIQGARALVAFNYAGEVFAGAVQVLDFTNPRQPRIVAEILYKNADATAVCFQGDAIYVGLGSNDPVLTSGAMLEEFHLSTNGRLERSGRWLDLPSGVVTDLGSQGGTLVATVGASGGGVAVIDQADLSVSSWHPEDDLRGFDFVTSGQVVAVCGTVPRMGSLMLPSLSGQMASIDGFTNPAAKGTVEVKNGLCWLGSGDGGFQVRDAEGALVSRLQNSEFSDTRPELMVANAVTLLGNRAYVAAGALGVQVVDVTSIINGSAEPTMRPMGELSFPLGMSSNMVKLRGNIMIAAAGTGGVKLVHVRTVGGDDG